MDRIDSVYNNIPKFYSRDTKSKIYTIIKAIVDEFDNTQVSIDKLQNMIGIDSTPGTELYYKWGSLLAIPRMKDESDNAYRARLKLSIVQLGGGTAYALKYSVAVGLGINTDSVAMDERIKVYDAWNYTGSEIAHKDKGYVVVLVDLQNAVYLSGFQSIVQEAANNVKAAGVNVQVIFSNFRIYYYADLANITYDSLANLTYSQIGE